MATMERPSMNSYRFHTQELLPHLTNHEVSHLWTQDRRLPQATISSRCMLLRPQDLKTSIFTPLRAKVALMNMVCSLSSSLRVTWLTIRKTALSWPSLNLMDRGRLVVAVA